MRRACRAAAWLLAASAVSAPAWAGRPLTVDDANVAEVGGGQVETWYARPVGRDRLWTSTLGVGVLEGLELGAGVERNFSVPETSSTVQAKMRLTPAVAGGCNAGAVVGRMHLHRARGDASYANGLFSCNLDGGPLHLNLGAHRPDGGGTQATWGLAKEAGFGAVTAHVEAFGQQHGKPTLQFGLRREIATNLQIDGTLGRSERKAVFSLGVRLGF
ncbi:MAG: hypothetical protein QM777_21720 [Pseudorhodoferax sp.]